MVARVLLPWLPAWRNTNASPARATMKALPSTLHPPSPLRSTQRHFVRLMRMRADQSAVGAINRPLQMGG